MSDQKLTDKFGAMTYVSTGGKYETELEVLLVGSLKSTISAEEFEGGLEKTSAFLAWLSENDFEFKLSLEHEIQNHDLIWDDVWDSVLGNEWVDAEDAFLGECLRYESVDFRQGTVHIWIDTSGLHMDHKIRATISDTMQIRCCELM